MAKHSVTLRILAVVGSIMSVSSALADAPRFVNSRRVALCYATAAQTTIDQVHVWVSTDCGRSWQRQPDVRQFDDRVLCQTPADGRYDFYLVLENEAGTSAPPPQPGTRPHSRVIVDTTPPLMQIHACEPAVGEYDQPILRFRVSLIEEHQSTRGCRLFYRVSPTDLWQDGGEVCVTGDTAEWQPPEFDVAEVEVKLVAADQAGNRAVSSVFPVQLPRRERTPTTQPAPEQPQPIALAADTLQTVIREPLPPADPQRIDGLRQLALRYLREGRHPLAEARLRDALELAPNDVDLNIDLGTVLYHAKRFDAAGESYQKALGLDPDHAGALEGLAVVAATRRQYPQARMHLQRLLERNPDSALTWLRLGDVEHKLGHRTEALTAWRRATEAPADKPETHSRATLRLKRFGETENLQLTSSAR